MDEGMVENKGGVLVTPPRKLNQHMDWLEITYPILGQNVNIEYPEHWSKTRVETKPLNGYKVAVRYADGRIEMINPDQPSMGVHVVLAAKTLATLREDDKWLARYFLENGAKVTRIDFALDCFDTGLIMGELWENALSGDYDCRLRKPPLRTHDTGTGDTIYFGRMKSSVCTRIYNKAAEQNVSGDWFRVETMMRHSRANNAAKRFASTDAEVASFIRGHVNLPRFKWWTDIFTMKAEKTRLDPATQSKRYEWLMRSVAPTLAKEIFLNGDSVYDDFKARVLDCLEIERQKSYKLSN